MSGRIRDLSVASHRGQPRIRPLTAVALALVLVTGFVAWWRYWPAASPAVHAAAPAMSATQSPSPSPEAAPTGAAPGAEAVIPPTRVRIPRIGVSSKLIPLRLDGHGAMETPQDFSVAGWYAEGTVPGEIGPAVIAGHVDSRSGPAVFNRLTELRAGDLIEVTRGDRKVTFTVVSTGRYPKDDFPTARVYGPTPDAQLRLITCGGSFDTVRRSYRDNIVVYATLQ